MSKRHKRRRETELRRRGPRREEREVHLVVCEGETEKRYFETMRAHPGVRLHTIHPKRAKHPQRRTVVEAALAQGSDEYTGVWAVFDTDGDDVTLLVAEARRGGVDCAPSTPTFETWLLLHLRDHRAAIVSGAKGEKLLKSLLPTWSKGRGTRFDDFAHGLDDACARAEALPPGTDPGTDVHRLLRAIRRA